MKLIRLLTICRNLSKDNLLLTNMDDTTLGEKLSLTKGDEIPFDAAKYKVEMVRVINSQIIKSHKSAEYEDETSQNERKRKRKNEDKRKNYEIKKQKHFETRKSVNVDSLQNEDKHNNYEIKKQKQVETRKSVNVDSLHKKTTNEKYLSSLE